MKSVQKNRCRGLLTGLFVMAVASILMICLSGPAFAIRTGATHFKFAPPDGTTWTETIKETRVETVDGQPFASNLFITKVQYTIRKIEDGYSVVRRPISFKAPNADGPDVQLLEATMEEMSQMTLCELELDSNGSCTGIRGFGKGYIDRLTEAVHTRIPNLTGEPDSSFATMAAQKRGTEWEVRYSLFTGLQAKPGEKWKGGFGLAFLPTFTIPFNINMQYASNVKVNGKDYARLKFKTAPDPGMELQLAEALAYYDGTDARFVDKFKVDLSDHSASDVHYSFKGEWILDPATLLYHHTKEMAEMKWVDSVTGEGVFQHAMKSTIETSFDYAGQKKSQSDSAVVKPKAKPAKKSAKSTKKK